MCCYDETKRTQVLKIHSHDYSLILFLIVDVLLQLLTTSAVRSLCVCVLCRLLLTANVAATAHGVSLLRWYVEDLLWFGPLKEATNDKQVREVLQKVCKEIEKEKDRGEHWVDEDKLRVQVWNPDEAATVLNAHTPGFERASCLCIQTDGNDDDDDDDDDEKHTVDTMNTFAVVKCTDENMAVRVEKCIKRFNERFTSDEEMEKSTEEEKKRRQKRNSHITEMFDSICEQGTLPSLENLLPDWRVPLSKPFGDPCCMSQSSVDAHHASLRASQQRRQKNKQEKRAKTAKRKSRKDNESFANSIGDDLDECTPLTPKLS